MINATQMIETLRDHRPLLLACEAIGWLHMAGKAHPDFLRGHGGLDVKYDYEDWLNSVTPPFPWSAKLSWLLDQNTAWHARLSSYWPGTLTEFLTKHREANTGILGLLQAGHAMASGIEKNIPRSTSDYLGQDVTHMWLTTAFGHPVRNLLQDPPEVLTPSGWQRLVGEIDRILSKLQSLGQANTNDVEAWWRWRERAIGPESYLRRAFLSTLAETRLPNNDVTLWDQSYVAAALFKSAVAGAVLAPFLLSQAQLKQKTRWRILTVGFGTRHYEARAVKIGDWTGAHRAIEAFFEDVRKFIEVNIAVGSLVYRDDEIMVFTFPGLSEDGRVGLNCQDAEMLRQEIEEHIDKLAKEYHFETPPLCMLSGSTRSFVGMVKELREARNKLAVPLHRDWAVKSPEGQSGQVCQAASQSTTHVCPVCQVRLNKPKEKDPVDNVRKSPLCGICDQRRRGRLDSWLRGEEDSIWISEIADENDHVALLTLSLDIEPWLEGERVDSLRAQSIQEWKQHNVKVSRTIENQTSSYKHLHLSERLQKYFEKRLSNPPAGLSKEKIFTALIPDFEEEFRGSRDVMQSWASIFSRLAEDRSNAPKFNELTNDKRAQWLFYQVFRKLPSPGRVYRFWRNAETFFQELLVSFREIVSAHPNRWRVQRLVLRPKAADNWDDRETYSTRWREAPLELLWLEEQGCFITISNLARCLEAHESEGAFQGEIFDDRGQSHELNGKKAEHVTGALNRLGVYAPLIPLELNPRRFRVLVPLDRATACIEAAMAKWRDEFGRVWDRLPLRIGIVAFARMTPFQAVIETVRNLEASLDEPDKETWRVEEVKTRDGITALRLTRRDGGQELGQVPIRLPDGRDDVFYPYVEVEDRVLRFPRDFQHPEGRVYRHVGDLRTGDGISVWPSLIATVFLDTTARRFEKPRLWPLAEFTRMREVWELVRRTAPSTAALRGAWLELAEKQEQWRDRDGRWLEGAEEQWRALVRAVLADRWQAKGAALEALVEAARDGLLEWAIEWHLTWLKEKLEG
jgi:hypothetical protein